MPSGPEYKDTLKDMINCIQENWDLISFKYKHDYSDFKIKIIKDYPNEIFDL
jgi:hypothetical protein